MMPTGYTAAVQSGKVTEFADFAMGCARQFGALITMRDEPSDALIPDVIPAETDYHDRALAKAQARFDQLIRLTAEECESQVRLAREAVEVSFLARREEQNLHRERYEAMLAKVEAWTPPTSEHFEMKEFMRKQLQDSIEHDCFPLFTSPSSRTGLDWWQEEITKAAKDIGYHSAHRAMEIIRATARTRWLQNLRASLVTASTPAEGDTTTGQEPTAAVTGPAVEPQA